MNSRTDNCDRMLNTAPIELRRIMADYSWQEMDLGYTQTHKFYLQSPEKGNCYLKIDSRCRYDELLHEYKVISWLQDKLPVPRVLYFDQTEDYNYLLISEVPGAASCDEKFRSDIPTVIRLLAKGLRMVHMVDIRDCPFDQRIDQKIMAAEYRVDNGLVDENDFETEWSNLSAQDILAKLKAEWPEGEDFVFTHGDYCLPNILIEGDRLGGFIDWGRGGISDRYQDLALAARSLAHNWGREWVPLLFAAYDLADIDERKLDYYRLMDELF